MGWHAQRVLRGRGDRRRARGRGGGRSVRQPMDHAVDGRRLCDRYTPARPHQSARNVVAGRSRFPAGCSPASHNCRHALVLGQTRPRQFTPATGPCLGSNDHRSLIGRGTSHSGRAHADRLRGASAVHRGRHRRIRRVLAGQHRISAPPGRRLRGALTTAAFESHCGTGTSCSS